jgi:hypothetical protein
MFPNQFLKSKLVHQFSSSPRIGAAPLIFEKLPINRTLGKKSPNLVTLAARSIVVDIRTVERQNVDRHISGFDFIKKFASKFSSKHISELKFYPTVTDKTDLTETDKILGFTYWHRKQKYRIYKIFSLSVNFA